MSDTAKTPRRYSLQRLFRFFIVLALVFLLCGFIGYVLHVLRLTPVAPVAKADGIVVLTGTGGGRIATGASLLEQGYGERLLVSGVHKDTPRSDIKTLMAISDDSFSCCVDLGYDAQNTIGNADEAADWARSMGYQTLIIVTSDYHMPRARIELEKAMGDITLISYPVAPPDMPKSSWWRSGDVLSRLVREYFKLVIIYIRDAGERSERSPAPVPPVTTDSETAQ